MEMIVGRSYYSGTAKTHAVDVLQVAQEPGRGTVALCSYYNVSEPRNTQMELFNLDGIYRFDRTPDPAWDISGEYVKPATGELLTGRQNSLFDRQGRPVHPMIHTRAMVLARAKLGEFPIVKFCYDKNVPTEYMALEVLSDAEVGALMEVNKIKER